MIRLKHLFDSIEKEDGERIWIEGIGLTRDLVEWCQITHVMTTLGPSTELAGWFEEHPSCFDFFEAQYLKELQVKQYRTAMRQLATASINTTFTLVHHGDNPNENSAVVLRQFLSELSERVPPRDKR
jgi:uncharacterized protein YeaO (DUF488 family)